MAPIIRSQNSERGFALVAERRSPQAGFLSDRLAELGAPSISTSALVFEFEKRDAQASPSSVPVVNPPPDSIKALAGIIVFLGVVVFGVAAWKLRRLYKKRWAVRDLTPSSSPLPEKIVSQRRNSLVKRTLIEIDYSGVINPFPRALLLPQEPTSEKYVGWVPQVRSVDRDPFASMADSPTSIAMPKPAKRRESRFSRFTLGMRSPRANKTTFVSPTSSLDSQILPPLPPPPKKKQKPSRLLPRVRSGVPNGPLPSVPIGATVSEITQVLTAPVGLGGAPIKSPSRFDSVSPLQPSHFAEIKRRTKDSHSSVSNVSDTRLPRLVFVANLYTPSMPDELHIKLGEILRLNEEFKDGWCAVQRVGKADAEQGVVPRFCVQDRPELSRTQSGRISIVHPSGTFRLGAPR